MTDVTSTILTFAIVIALGVALYFTEKKAEQKAKSEGK